MKPRMIAQMHDMVGIRMYTRASVLLNGSWYKLGLETGVLRRCTDRGQAAMR